MVEIQCDERVTGRVRERDREREAMCVYYRYKDSGIFPERSAVQLR